MEQLTQRIIKVYKKHIVMDASQEAILKYGIYLTLSAGIGVLCTLAISFIIGLFSTALVIILTMSTLRYVSGGAHFIKMSHCVLMTMFITNMIALIVQYIPISFEGAFTLALLSFTFGLYSIQHYAPADTPQKPIVNKTQRKKLKERSLILLCLWFLAIIIIFINEEHRLQGFVIATALGIGWQCLTLAPKGYRLYHQMDILFDKIKGKKQEEVL